MTAIVLIDADYPEIAEPLKEGDSNKLFDTAELADIWIQDHAKNGDTFRIIDFDD